MALYRLPLIMSVTSRGALHLPDRALDRVLLVPDRALDRVLLVPDRALDRVLDPTGMCHPLASLYTALGRVLDLGLAPVGPHGFSGVPSV
jgi:hypothetical protein